MSDYTSLPTIGDQWESRDCRKFVPAWWDRQLTTHFLSPTQKSCSSSSAIHNDEQAARLSLPQGWLFGRLKTSSQLFSGTGNECKQKNCYIQRGCPPGLIISFLVCSTCIHFSWYFITSMSPESTHPPFKLSNFL